jgi:hypothetical protein
MTNITDPNVNPTGTTKVTTYHHLNREGEYLWAGCPLFSLSPSLVQIASLAAIAAASASLLRRDVVSHGSSSPIVVAGGGRGVEKIESASPSAKSEGACDPLASPSCGIAVGYRPGCKGDRASISSKLIVTP